MTFLPSAHVPARLMEQGRVGQHLLGDKPMKGEATLVEAVMVAINRLHFSIVAQGGGPTNMSWTITSKVSARDWR